MTAVWDYMIFAVQDRTGTVAQLTIENPNSQIAPGDTGVYNGLDFNGQEVALDFTVGAVNDPNNFCITTMLPSGAPGAFIQSQWPKEGFITWLTGENVNDSPNETVVVARNVANAYCTVDYFQQYHLSRGNAYPVSPIDGIMTAIVQASDYLDQRYRFKGVKLFQFLADNPAINPVIGLLDPWLMSYGFFGGGPGNNMLGFVTASSTFQHTEWPRQGCVDFNGDNVYGVPLSIQNATAEAALRVLNGTPLQPDYDPTVVSNGGVLASYSDEVGPIKTSRTFDTKLGLGFFPSIPQVDRILRSAGLLVAGGGRSVIL
jgi:hypothetical protein